jgi:hypothetical protein
MNCEHSPHLVRELLAQKGWGRWSIPCTWQEDDDAASALYIASFNGHAAIVRALLDAGADHRAVTVSAWVLGTHAKGWGITVGE